MNYIAIKPLIKEFTIGLIPMELSKLKTLGQFINEISKHFVRSKFTKTLYNRPAYNIALPNTMDTCKFLEDWVKYLDTMYEDGRKKKQSWYLTYMEFKTTN